MINCDHWAWVEVGLDETPSLRIIFNDLKNTNKNQINKGKFEIFSKKKQNGKLLL